MTEADALFIRDGNQFVPTDFARGGWSHDAQHGGPPAGLLAHAADLLSTRTPMRMVRLTVDLFREIPLSPLTVSTSVVRDGQRIQLLNLVLEAADGAVASASALKIRISDEAIPSIDTAPWTPPPPPEDCQPIDWEDSDWGWVKRAPGWFFDAIEIRAIDGTFFGTPSARTWFRLRIPVVDGEPSTPFTRLAALADVANGNAQQLDPLRWLYVNPDISIVTFRRPTGEWIGMDSHAQHTSDGIGYVSTLLFDSEEPFGTVGQTRLLAPHSPSTMPSSIT